MIQHNLSRQDSNTVSDQINRVKERFSILSRKVESRTRALNSSQKSSQGIRERLVNLGTWLDDATLELKVTDYRDLKKKMGDQTVEYEKLMSKCETMTDDPINMLHKKKIEKLWDMLSQKIKERQQATEDLMRSTSSMNDIRYASLHQLPSSESLFSPHKKYQRTSSTNLPTVVVDYQMGVPMVELAPPRPRDSLTKSKSTTCLNGMKSTNYQQEPYMEDCLYPKMMTALPLSESRYVNNADYLNFLSQYIIHHMFKINSMSNHNM